LRVFAFKGGWFCGFSDGSRSKFFNPGGVRSIFCGLGQVGSAIYGLGLNLENFSQKCQIFNFFPFGSKKSLWVGSKSTWVEGWPASYLLRVKSKLGSGQGPSLCGFHPGQESSPGWPKRIPAWNHMTATYGTRLLNIVWRLVNQLRWNNSLVLYRLRQCWCTLNTFIRATP